MRKSTSKCNEQVLWDKVSGTSGSSSKNTLSVRPCRGDGNCCFRAFSDQLYGNQVHHLAIRRYAVLLMRLYSDHFGPFVADSTAASFEDYLKQICCDAVWADDMELQAVSMLYRRPIEVYDGNKNKMRTLHEDSRPGDPTVVPFRIMYRLSHYSSLRKKGEPFPLIPDRPPGEVETWSLQEHKRFRKHLCGSDEQSSSAGEEGSTISENDSSESIYTENSGTGDSSSSSGSLACSSQSDSTVQSHKPAAFYPENTGLPESFSAMGIVANFSPKQNVLVNSKPCISKTNTDSSNEAINHPIVAGFCQYANDDWWLTDSPKERNFLTRSDCAPNAVFFGVQSSAYHTRLNSPFMNHNYSYDFDLYGQRFPFVSPEPSYGNGPSGWGTPNSLFTNLSATSQLPFPSSHVQPVLQYRFHQCGSKNPFRNY